MIGDATLGRLLQTINTLFFVYWILWIAVTPFVDASHFTQKFFPPREYGIAIPVMIVTTLVVVSMTVASVHIIRKTGLTEEVLKRRSEALKAPHSQPPPPLQPLLSGVAASNDLMSSPRSSRSAFGA